MSELRATPFAGTPSETYHAGWCPGCGGTGKVERSVPVDGTYVCASCNGGGTRASFDALMEAIGKEELERG